MKPLITNRSDGQLTAEVLAHPKFKAMARQKAWLGWSFSAIMFLVYVAFILVIGIAPELLAQRVSENGVTTFGVYIGVFVIVFSFLMTLIYVSLANGRYEQMTQDVVNEVMGGKNE